MITINSKVLAFEELSFPFNSDSGRYWQYISDQVMGGISDGEVTLEQDGEMYYARLSGNVSTCLLYTSPSPRDRSLSRMPSSA